MSCAMSQSSGSCYYYFSSIDEVEVATGMSLLNPDDPFNPTPYQHETEPQRVVVTNIDMTIGDMCRFMVKWAIAAVPASIILAVIWLGVAAVFLFLYRSFFVR